MNIARTFLLVKSPSSSPRQSLRMSPAQHWYLNANRYCSCNQTLSTFRTWHSIKLNIHFAATALFEFSLILCFPYPNPNTVFCGNSCFLWVRTGAKVTNKELIIYSRYLLNWTHQDFSMAISRIPHFWDFYLALKIV